MSATPGAGRTATRTACPTAPPASRDQLANLNTDSGNNGTNAQQGYVVGGCGIIVPGVRVAYSLLISGGANFYLDTTNAAAPMVRQVRSSRHHRSPARHPGRRGGC